MSHSECGEEFACLFDVLCYIIVRILTSKLKKSKKNIDWTTTVRVWIASLDRQTHYLEIHLIQKVPVITLFLSCTS